MNGETIAMIKALQVKSIEELKTSGGSADAGKVLTVGSDGKLIPAELEVGEGQVAVDGSLSVSGAAADAKETGDAIRSLNGSLGAFMNTVPVDTANGAIATFADGADDIPVKNLTVNIAPVQSGTGDPSPDNVRPISGWTGAKITHTGKNLFDINKYIEAGASKVSSAAHPDTYTGNKWRFYYKNGNCTTNNAAGGLVGRKKFGRLRISFYKYNSNIDRVYFHYTGASAWDNHSGNISSAGMKSYTSDAGRICDGVALYTTQGDNATFQFGELSVTIVDGSTDTTYPGSHVAVKNVDWSEEVGEVYGGVIDVTNGIIHPYKYYSSYNGETLSGEWISSLDVYSADASPTIGAQVVDFGEFVEDISITPQEVKTLLGDNNIFTDTGDVSVEYRADIKKYIDKVVATAISALS